MTPSQSFSQERLSKRSDQRLDHRSKCGRCTAWAELMRSHRNRADYFEQLYTAASDSCVADLLTNLKVVSYGNTLLITQLNSRELFGGKVQTATVKFIAAVFHCSAQRLVIPGTRDPGVGRLDCRLHENDEQVPLRLDKGGLAGR